MPRCCLLALFARRVAFLATRLSYFWESSCIPAAHLSLASCSPLAHPLPPLTLLPLQANMTPFAKQCLSEMAPKYLIELFQEAELLVRAGGWAGAGLGLG